uniref:Molybdopterin synthase catalytic subunit n=1 Tax=Tabanus bromius TaxID=304241 RepID=A0A0K8TTC0_TABBR
MDYTELSKEPLDIGAINTLVLHESCGAVSMFIGTTRDNFESKKVLSLEYEAYEPMAIKSMKSICSDIRSKWPDIKNIAIFHRLGLVPVKEASVIIAISSPHRESSLQAVSHAIDELKKSVPIWKKELYDDNNAEWKENKECQWRNK